MTNMIGKSGTDWSKAPEGATHRNKDYGNGYREWYMDDGTPLGQVYWEESKRWVALNRARCECISKEEDLPVVKQVTKQVRTIEDLEVGMFLNTSSWRVDGPVRRMIIRVSKYKFTTINMDSEVICEWSELDLERVVDSWSYTYDGEYTSTIKETAKEKAIKAAQEEITQAQINLDNAKRKLDEAIKA